MANASTTAIAATTNHTWPTLGGYSRRSLSSGLAVVGAAARDALFPDTAGRALATITPQRGQAGVVTPGAPHRGHSIARHGNAAGARDRLESKPQ